MNNKNENKKMNLDVKVNMIKKFISEISNKKKIIKAFKKKIVEKQKKIIKIKIDLKLAIK